MRRFILKILMLAAAMMVVDILMGVVFRHWFERMDDGEMGKENYIGRQVDEDILVFGSSRAEYHYDIKVISELSGRSCYNCGASGNGIILAYGRLLMALQHHRPQLIIYDVNPEFDVLESDNHRSLAQMKISGSSPSESSFSAISSVWLYRMQYRSSTGTPAIVMDR